MSEKIYVGLGKEIETQYGALLKLSFTKEHLETMQGNLKNDWINLVVKKRKEPSASGITHYLEVDTWVPDNTNHTAKPASDMTEKISVDDLPF